MAERRYKHFATFFPTNKITLEDVFLVFRRKIESRLTANYKWHKLTFQPKRKSLPQFLGELNEYTERAFGDQALQRIDSFLYAKMPPHLASSINLAYLKNGKYDQIVAHLESEVELSGIENDEQLTILTMTATVKGNNENKSDLSKTSCLHCKKLGHLTKGCRKINPKEQEQKQDTNQKKTTFTPKTYSFCPRCQIKNHPPEICWRGPNAAKRPQKFKQHSLRGDNQGNLTESTYTLNTPSMIFKNTLN